MKMLQVSKCLIGLAVMALQSCETADNCRDQLCGNWESVEGKPDVLIYKEATDILTFSPGGDYIRSAKKAEDDMEHSGLSFSKDMDGASFSELNDIFKEYDKK